MAYTNRGLEYWAKGEFDRAIADHNKAIEIDPRLALAYINRGVAHAAKKGSLAPLLGFQPKPVRTAASTTSADLMLSLPRQAPRHRTQHSSPNERERPSSFSPLGPHPEQ